MASSTERIGHGRRIPLADYRTGRRTAGGPVPRFPGPRLQLPPSDAGPRGRRVPRDRPGHARVRRHRHSPRHRRLHERARVGRTDPPTRRARPRACGVRRPRLRRARRLDGRAAAPRTGVRAGAAGRSLRARPVSAAPVGTLCVDGAQALSAHPLLPGTRRRRSRTRRRPARIPAATVLRVVGRLPLPRHLAAPLGGQRLPGRAARRPAAAVVVADGGRAGSLCRDLHPDGVQRRSQLVPGVRRQLGTRRGISTAPTSRSRRCSWRGRTIRSSR